MILILFLDLLRGLIVLNKISYTIKNIAKKKYISVNGQLGKLEDNTKENVIFYKYSFPDESRPFAIVSYDNQRAMTINEKNEIVFNDTKLFEAYKQNKTRCDLRVNENDKMCMKLTDILDPIDNEEASEEETRSHSSSNNNTVEAKDLKGVRLNTFFIWTVEIANETGGQRIIHKKTGYCLSHDKDMLLIEPCDKNERKHDKWKLKEVREMSFEKQLEEERINNFSNKVLSRLKHSGKHTEDSEDNEKMYEDSQYKCTSKRKKGHRKRKHADEDIDNIKTPHLDQRFPYNNGALPPSQQNYQQMPVVQTPPINTSPPGIIPLGMSVPTNFYQTNTF